MRWLATTFTQASIEVLVGCLIQHGSEPTDGGANCHAIPCAAKIDFP